jgi:hypothetical protein
MFGFFTCCCDSCSETGKGPGLRLGLLDFAFPAAANFVRQDLSFRQMRVIDGLGFEV